MQNYELRTQYEKLCKDVILRLYEFGNESGFELLDKKRDLAIDFENLTGIKWRL